MKNQWNRGIAAIVAGLGMCSCFTFEEMFGYLGYLPVQGLPYTGNSIGGSLMVRDFGNGRMITNFAVEDLPGRAALYTGALDGGGFGQTYDRQFPLRLGPSYPDFKIRDIGTRENGESVGVGTDGSVVAFGGDECLRALDPITDEDLNTVLWSPALGSWLAAGNNGSLFRSDNRLDWNMVPVPGLPEGTHFRKSANFSQGALLVSDERITELTPGQGNQLSIGYGIGFGKKFKSVTAIKDWYLALAEDTDKGGSVALERTDNTFNFASQFSPIFSSKYRDFFAYGESVYFFRDDDDSDNASTVEIRNYSDGAVSVEKRLPITLDHHYSTGDTIYIAGRNRWHERQIWRANLDFSDLSPITTEPQDRTLWAAECLDAGRGPTWSVYGEDLNDERSGIQFNRYQGSDGRVATIGGTSGSGTVYDTVRLSSRLALGVGNYGGKPLFFTDSGREASAIMDNGLGGILFGIEYDRDTGTSLAANHEGAVFSADLSGVSKHGDLNGIEWKKESLPWRLDAMISTTGERGFYYKIQDGEATDDDIAHRDAGGNWSSFKVDFSSEINDLYFDPVLEKLFIATESGLGYRSQDGQQGVLPLQIGGRNDLAFHQILGDRHGDRLHFVAGIRGALEGPCMVGELGFGGVATPNPTVEIIDDTAPSRNSSMIESAGFFGCLGNRSLFSLYPRRFEDWPEYAQHLYGDSSIPPGGDLDGNGISNLDQAVGGLRGPQAHIQHLGGYVRAGVSLFPFLPRYTVQPERSNGLGEMMPFRPITYPSPTGGLEFIEPVNDSSYYRFNIEYSF